MRGFDWSQGANVITDDDYSPLTPDFHSASKLDLKTFSGKWPGITRNEVKALLALQKEKASA